MTDYVQDPPYTVKIEFSEGCNLACKFCGINSIREKPGKLFNFMTVQTVERIAQEVARLGWTSRLELAMHGEPSMNPNFVRIIEAIHKHLPDNQIMMTSNGAGYLRDIANVDAAFDAGLNILCLDDYQNVNIVPKVLERYALTSGKVQVINYPESRAHSPYKRWPKGTKVIVVFAYISIPQPGVHNRLDNMGGMAAPRTHEQDGKRCGRPFREIAFRWDGKVATCCDDWRGQYLCGDITRQSLDEIWQGEAFMALRRKLYAGERDFGACNGCSDMSYRTGLLPDRMGKREMGPVTAKDKLVIATAMSHNPLTTVVKRPWETVAFTKKEDLLS
jgi:MoaA/NifB/PqqE/SkfB family radical SAM enzyme